MRKTLAITCFTGLLLGGMAAPAFAEPLPENCERVRGTVTCTTEESPGNNQGGVGSVSTTETKGNTTNKSPEPQNLEDDCTQNPPKAQGSFACP